MSTKTYLHSVRRTAAGRGQTQTCLSPSIRTAEVSFRRPRSRSRYLFVDANDDSMRRQVRATLRPGGAGQSCVTGPAHSVAGPAHRRLHGHVSPAWRAPRNGLKIAGSSCVCQITGCAAGSPPPCLCVSYQRHSLTSRSSDCRMSEPHMSSDGQTASVSI